MKKQLAVVVVVAANCLSAAQADDLADRLHHARSLRCWFTDSTVTEYKSGVRTIAVTHDKSAAVYDNINLEHRSARIIGNIGAADLTALWQAGALWFILQAPNGNVVVTTVFPTYVAGTNQFIIIESRHWAIGQFASGEQGSGNCEVLD
jgi:hypothetical protein